MDDPLKLTLNEKLLLDNLLNGVCLIDASKRIVYWNAAAEQILGYVSEDMTGRACDDEIFTRGSVDGILCLSHCPLKHRIEFTASTAAVNLRHKNGYRLPVEMRCIPLLNDENNVTGAIKIFGITLLREDIDTKLKELGQIAYLDALTSIPNRRYIEEILQEWLQPDNRRDFPYAVVMGDLDFFKKINDEHGHDAGDIVLKKVAEILRKNLRITDIVARWGGEEFLALLHNINRKQLINKLESLRKTIETCKFESKDSLIEVTMSFGAAMPCKGDTAASIVARADELLYKSKREGRNRVSVAEETATLLFN